MCFCVWRIKDAFPGADGSISTLNVTIPIYDASGNTLTEGNTGLRQVNITTAGVLSGNTSQLYAFKNPLTFIWNSTSPYDWYTNTDNHNDALWHDVEGKSNYDPCPNGWTVPQDGTWNDFTPENTPYYIQGDQISSGDKFATNGRLYNIMVWYPAVGYRRSGANGFGNVGNCGYYWSSTITNTFSVVLGFNMSIINNHRTENRAGGFPVRCVQE